MIITVCPIIDIDLKSDFWDYKTNEDLELFSLVSVSFGFQKQIPALVVNIEDAKLQYEIKLIDKVIKREPIMDHSLYDSFLEVSKNTLASLSKILFVYLPYYKSIPYSFPSQKNNNKILFEYQTFGFFDKYPSFFVRLYKIVQFSINRDESTLLFFKDKKTIDFFVEFLKSTIVDFPVIIFDSNKKKSIEQVFSHETKLVISSLSASFLRVHNLKNIIQVDDIAFLDTKRFPSIPLNQILYHRSKNENLNLLYFSKVISPFCYYLFENEQLTILNQESKMDNIEFVEKEKLEETEKYKLLPSLTNIEIREKLRDFPVLIELPGVLNQNIVICKQCKKGARCVDCKGLLRSNLDETRCQVCSKLVNIWKCYKCSSQAFVKIGKTGGEVFNELTKMYPDTKLIYSSNSTKVIPKVDYSKELILSSPNAEPYIIWGYSNITVMDANKLAFLFYENSYINFYYLIANLYSFLSNGSKITLTFNKRDDTIDSLRKKSLEVIQEEMIDSKILKTFPFYRTLKIEGYRNVVEDLKEKLEEKGFQFIGEIIVEEKNKNKNQQQELNFKDIVTKTSSKQYLIFTFIIKTDKLSIIGDKAEKLLKASKLKKYSLT